MYSPSKNWKPSVLSEVIILKLLSGNLFKYCEKYSLCFVSRSFSLNLLKSLSKFNDLSEEQFIDFMMEGKKDIFYEYGRLYQGKYFLSDPVLYGEIESTLNITVSSIKYMDYAEQSEALYRISLIKGTTKMQIARITGMNYSQVCRTIKDFFKKCVLTELEKQKGISNIPVEQITAITKLVLDVLKNNRLMV